MKFLYYILYFFLLYFLFINYFFFYIIYNSSYIADISFKELNLLYTDKRIFSKCFNNILEKYRFTHGSVIYSFSPVFLVTKIQKILSDFGFIYNTLDIIYKKKNYNTIFLKVYFNFLDSFFFYNIICTEKNYLNKFLFYLNNFFTSNFSYISKKNIQIFLKNYLSTFFFFDGMLNIDFTGSFFLSTTNNYKILKFFNFSNFFVKKVNINYYYKFKLFNKDKYKYKNIRCIFFGDDINNCYFKKKVEKIILNYVTPLSQSSYKSLILCKKNIEYFLRSHGFLDVRIVVVCTTYNIDKEFFVDIFFGIIKKKKYIVDKIHIFGNYILQDNVLRKCIFQNEFNILDYNKIILSKNKLLECQLVSDILIKIKKVKENDKVKFIELIFYIKEKKYHECFFSLNYFFNLNNLIYFFTVKTGNFFGSDSKFFFILKKQFSFFNFFLNFNTIFFNNLLIGFKYNKNSFFSYTTFYEKFFQYFYNCSLCKNKLSKFCFFEFYIKKTFISNIYFKFKIFLFRYFLLDLKKSTYNFQQLFENYYIFSKIVFRFSLNYKYCCYNLFLNFPKYGTFFSFSINSIPLISFFHLEFKFNNFFTINNSGIFLINLECDYFKKPSAALDYKIILWKNFYFYNNFLVSFKCSYFFNFKYLENVRKYFRFGFFFKVLGNINSFNNFHSFIKLNYGITCLIELDYFLTKEIIILNIGYDFFDKSKKVIFTLDKDNAFLRHLFY